MPGSVETRCPKCDAMASPGAKFCENCGAGLAGAGGGKPGRVSSARLALAAVLVAVFVALAFAITSMREKPEAARQGEGLGPAPAAVDPARKREVEERVRALEGVAKQKPQDAAAWLSLAEARYELVALDPSTADAAIQAADKVLEVSPGNVEAYKLKGNVFFDVGRSKEAVVAYEEYLKIVPDDPGVRTDLGTMYMNVQDYDKAIGEYQKVLADHPNFVNAQFNLGHAYHQKGDMAKAEEAYEKVETMPGSNAEVRQSAAEYVRLLKKRAESGKGQAEGAPPAAAPAESGGTLRSDVEAVFTGSSVLGPRITKVEWASDSLLKISLKDFPMNRMPEDHMKKFTEKVTAARKKYGIEKPIEIQFLDDAGSSVQTKVEG